MADLLANTRAALAEAHLAVRQQHQQAAAARGGAAAAGGGGAPPEVAFAGPTACEPLMPRKR